MIRVGYLPCTQDPPSGAHMTRVIDEIMAEAQMAEASGWNGCFISEHHQQADGYLPNPLLMAGLVGMRTQRLTVGTSVLLLPLYHPVHVAERRSRGSGPAPRVDGGVVPGGVAAGRTAHRRLARRPGVIAAHCHRPCESLSRGGGGSQAHALYLPHA